jgi:poly(A) polymerase
VTALDAARRLAASSVLRRIAAAVPGAEVFLAGGSLRDRLLGLASHDHDIVVLREGRSVAHTLSSWSGGTCFSLGRPPLQTWRVVAPGLQIDVWEAQELKEDILRRDFTVNALLWRLPAGPLIDLAGGLADLAAGRLRVVRPANLLADPLRVLRGLRLLATRPQLRLTRETERHLAAAAGPLPVVARERTLDELYQLLAGPEVARALLTGARLGVLAALLPAWRDFDHAQLAASLAEALAMLAAGRHGTLASGARAVAPGLLATPAAGFPGAWNGLNAARALAALGLPLGAAHRISRAVAFGERLVAALDTERTARRVAAEAGDHLAPSLAWAVARRRLAAEDTEAAARRLLRFARAFAGRPPLLDGDEVARLLSLPADARRATAITALRLAQAEGVVRTREQARRWLVALTDFPGQC